MGRAGAPGPSTAQAPKGKGFPCSAGPWRVHCPMHPARSAVAPGALEIGHGPLPSSLGRWFRSSRSDRRAKCPQMVVQGLSQPIPASVGASSPGVDELRRPDQSQDFLFPQKANHHMCLRLSNSQMEFGVPCLIGTNAPTAGCSRPQRVEVGVLPGRHGAWGNLARVVVSCRLERPGRQVPSAGEGSLRLDPSRTGTLRM